MPERFLKLPGNDSAVRSLAYQLLLERFVDALGQRWLGCECD